MFEVVLTLCLAGDPAICRVTLLPAREASTLAACEKGVPAAPPVGEGLRAKGAASCRRVPDGLAFVEVAPGVFVHEGRIEEPDEANAGDVANIAFVVGTEAVAVIDAGSTRTIAEGVWRAIRARTDLPVRYLILTHVHPDHSLGAPLFADAGAEVVAHEDLPRAMADRQANYLESLSREIGAASAMGSGAVEVDVPVADRAALDLGGRVLDLRAWPLAHTGTDLSVRDGGSGLLFTGDLVFDRHVPALDGSIRGWQAVLADLRAQTLQGAVPGHGSVLLPWPEGVEATARYLDVLAGDTREAIDRGVRVGEAARTAASAEAGRWQLFDAFNARNATVAFAELEWE